MLIDLEDTIEKMRTCGSVMRSLYALELASTGSEKAVDELIKMARGKHRKGFRWFNYEDQLTAIKALAETKTEKTLDYLKSLLIESVKVYAQCNNHTDGPSELIYKHHYPHAAKRLRIALEYSDGCIICENGRYINPHRYEALQIINNSIARIKNSPMMKLEKML